MMPPTVAPSLEAILSLHIQRSSPVPVYVQIAEAVRSAVQSIPLPAGTPLPAERTLSESLRVSKMTLRQAYGLLEREGLIECRRGVGTFVAHPRIGKSLPAMRSFTEEMRARGKTASSRLLSFQVTRGSQEAREFLELRPNELVYELHRLRLADATPIALERVQLPARLFPGLERFDLASQSLYTLLENSYRIQLVDCDEEISATRPTKLQRRLLEIGPSVALLVVTRRSYAAHEIPVEFAVTAYRGDIYTARIHALREAHDSEAHALASGWGPAVPGREGTLVLSGQERSRP